MSIRQFCGTVNSQRFLSVKFLISLSVFFFVSYLPLAHADQILLKTGEVLDATVLELTSDFIRIDLNSEPKSYLRDQVISINGVALDGEVAPPKAEPSPESESTTETATPPPSSNPYETNSEDLVNKQGAPQEEYLLERMANQEKNVLSADVEMSNSNYIQRQFTKQLSMHWDQYLYALSMLEFFAPSLAEFIRSYSIDVKDFVLDPDNKTTLRYLLFIYYVIFSIALQQIAHRFRLTSWLAFIPVFQLVLLVKMADRPLLWFFLLFVPVINLFIWVMIWVDVFDLFQKPLALAALMLIPGIQLVLPWYVLISTRDISLRQNTVRYG